MMESPSGVKGTDSDPAYERLVYECTIQRTELERRLQEMERRIDRLKKENARLKARIKDLEESSPNEIHDLQRLGPMGKPMVF